MAVFALLLLAAPSCSNGTSDDGGDSGTPSAARYTVTFETDGGSAVAAQTVDSGATATRPTAEPTRYGDGFLGWYADSDCKTEYDFATAVTKDTTLYAKWDFVKIPSGTFTRTSGNTTQTVTLTKAYYMCDHEVTQKEYQAVIGNNPSNFSEDSVAVGEEQVNRPVEQVNWYQAIAYCNKLSINQGLQPCYTVGGSSELGTPPTSSDGTWNAAVCDFTKNGYRLPTEAEWEYAARAKGTTAGDKWSGTETQSELGNYAWYDANSESKTHEVKKKQPNALGLYDMSGNVWEWCYDRYGSYSGSSVTDPIGDSSGSGRAERGCSWNIPAVVFSVSQRGSISAESANCYLGFRVCRSAQ